MSMPVVREPTRATKARIRRDLRGMVNGEDILMAISRVHQMMLDGREPIVNAATGITTYVVLDTLRTTQLGRVLDLNFKLLAKVLPDLKSIELTGAALAGPQDSQDRMVLATKLLAVWREEDEQALKQVSDDWLS
jgi:hypothetical protein